MTASDSSAIVVVGPVRKPSSLERAIKISQLACGTQRYVEELAIFPGPAPCASFNNIRRHRHRGATDLLPQSEPFVARKTSGLFVDVQNECVGILEDPQLSMIATHTSWSATARPPAPSPSAQSLKRQAHAQGPKSRALGFAPKAYPVRKMPTKLADPAYHVRRGEIRPERPDSGRWRATRDRHDRYSVGGIGFRYSGIGIGYIASTLR